MAKKKQKPTARAKPPPTPSRPAELLYKVVEISNVDEGALERTINTWVPQGWVFDGVQFAMRESSKRPSMAFVFFTRDDGVSDTGRTSEEAYRHLRRIADVEQHDGPAPTAYERLVQLAEGED